MLEEIIFYFKESFLKDAKNHRLFTELYLSTKKCKKLTVSLEQKTGRFYFELTGINQIGLTFCFSEI